MHTHWKQFGTLVLAAALALSGCSGSKGDPGAKGDSGAQGIQGEPGVSTGTLSGVVKSQAGDPLAGVTVTLAPSGLASAPTGADGAYTIQNVAAGVYSATFAGTNVASKTDANVSVLAGQTITLNETLTYSPIVVAFTAPVIPPVGLFPVGFGQNVNVAANVTGATGALTYTWSISGPTAPALTVATDSQSASFTTGTVKQMFDGGKVQYWTIPNRKGLVAITAGQTANMNYVVTLKVTDGKYTQSKSITIPTGMFTSGTSPAPTGVPVIANDVSVAADGWQLTPPSGSTATLFLANDKNPYFIPDMEGAYVLKNGAADASPITVNVANWKGAPSADCGVCHSGTAVDAVAAKFKAWNNSAHGNTFFKYMGYDSSGTLVWLNDPATGVPYLAPTANVDANGKVINWTTPGRMTVAQYGLSNGEGTHYGESCVQCHAVGMNKLVANNGFDDQTGYAWPGNLLHDKDLTGKPMTAPDPAAWNAIPQGSRDMAGIQCENCHGPLGKHTSLANAPQSFYDAESCAVCHDRGGHHDKYQLWKQGGHSDMNVAMNEGTRADCGICHSAQGFVAWAATGFDPNFVMSTATPAATVQPITCQACHEPHSTGLRVDGTGALLTKGGYTVYGAGAGEVCVACHNNRRGARNDSIVFPLATAQNVSDAFRTPHDGPQGDVFFGQSFYFVPVADMQNGVTMATHAVVLEGTCTGCHMAQGLATESLVIAGVPGAIPSNTNHSFKVSENICEKCHEHASFEALKTSISAMMTSLTNAISAKAQAQFLATSAPYKVVGLTISGSGSSAVKGVATFTDLPTSFVLGSSGTTFTAKFDNGTTYTFLAADNASLSADQPVTVAAGGTVSIAIGSLGYGPVRSDSSTGSTTQFLSSYTFDPNADVMHAIWNLRQLQNDKSYGAHNPSFVRQVLSTSIAKMQ
jgi:hypothetical protein